MPRFKPLRHPRYYPTICEAEGWNPIEQAVCYDPRHPLRQTLSIDRSRALTVGAAMTLLQAIAARRGLLVASPVYQTARKWYVVANPCGESTYTVRKNNPPPEAA